MEGAASARERAIRDGFEQNDSMKYAAVRNILHRKGKSIEILANYEPSLHYVSEWWKQLCGESEGKDHKGIYPASVDLTTDLHSMGQFIQDGSRVMFETVLSVEDCDDKVMINEEAVDLDGLNYLAGKDMDFVNKSAMNRNDSGAHRRRGAEPAGDRAEAERVLPRRTVLFLRVCHAPSAAT